MPAAEVEREGDAGQRHRPATADRSQPRRGPPPSTPAAGWRTSAARSQPPRDRRRPSRTRIGVAPITSAPNTSAASARRESSRRKASVLVAVFKRARGARAVPLSFSQQPPEVSSAAWPALGPSGRRGTCRLDGPDGGEVEAGVGGLGVRVEAGRPADAGEAGGRAGAGPDGPAAGPSSQKTWVSEPADFSRSSRRRSWFRSPRRNSS